MTDVTCKIIPLYKFKVYYNEDNPQSGEYVWNVVSDTIAGLVKGIADREMQWSMKDCRKYLIVTDFLLMPCEDAIKGYHLFDIDNHDVAGYGTDIFEENFVCIFAGKEPTPVTAFYSLIREMFPETEEKKITSMWDWEWILADALYKSEEVEKAVADCVGKETDKKLRDLSEGREVLDRFFSKTG